MATRRRRRAGAKDNGNNRRRHGSRYGGNRNNGGDEQKTQRASSIAAEAMRATADRVAENTIATADLMHEQAGQFVDEVCQHTDLMARQVENFFGHWVKLVTWPAQMTRQAISEAENMREEQRAA